MIEVGETAEAAVLRELREEMNLILPPGSAPPRLFGVYNDPLRDARRHTASIVYVLDVPLDMMPRAGDDAVGVERLRLDRLEGEEFFVDHSTILADYRRSSEVQLHTRSADIMGRDGMLAFPAENQPFQRSVCPLNLR